MAYYILREKIIEGKEMQREDDIRESDYVKLMEKSAKFSFDSQYPPDFLKESWTELVKHIITFPSFLEKHPTQLNQSFLDDLANSVENSSVINFNNKINLFSQLKTIFYSCEEIVELINEKVEL